MTASLTKPETPPARRTLKKRRGLPWKLILQVLACQVVALLVVEAVLSWTGIGEEEIFRFDKEMGFVHIPNKRITWRSEGFATSCFDANGLRESGITVAKPANTVRVALLGDSLTEGLQVNYDDSFAHLLQQQLGEQLQGKQLQVINFACSGYSTTQELLLLEKQVLSFKPDLVLACYNNRDMIENWSTADQVITNVRPSAVHLPGGWLFLDNSTVKLWFKSPRGRFLTSIAWLREHSRIWGVYSAAELQLSQKNPVAKTILAFWSQPKVVIKETREQLAAWWQNVRKQPLSFAAPNVVTNKPAFSTAGLATKHAQGAQAAAALEPEGAQQSASAKQQSAGPVQQSAVSEQPAAAPSIQQPEAESPCMAPPSSVPLVPAALATAPGASATAPQIYVSSAHGAYGTVVFRTMDSLLDRMNEDCRRAGARFAVAAMPVRAVLCPTPEYSQEFAGITYADEVSQVQNSCARQGIPFIDVEQKAEALSKADREKLFYTAHLTPHGHKFTADALKDFLAKLIK